MLKTTSQQIIDRIGVGPDEVGRPVVLGSTVDLNAASGGNAVLKQIPKGYVLAVTKVTSPTGGIYGVSGLLTKDALLGSPSAGTGGTSGFIQVDVEQTAGDSDMSLKFLRFARYSSLFGGASSPDYRRALPAKPAEWRPKYPLVIPSEWTVSTADYSAANYGEAVPGPSFYGVLMSEGDALMLGLCTGNTSPTSERFTGFASASGTGGTETLVPGQAGKCIRILDIHVRFQPSTNTNSSLSLQQSDGSRTIIKLTNSNPAEMIERQISPDIFLKSAADLELVTTTADVQTVNVSYEYVDEDAVPGDAWWSEASPVFGTPGAGTSGYLNLYTQAITEMTVYYPKLDTTATVPGKGRQHLVRGFAISAQKDGSTSGTSDDVDQACIAVVGAATGGSVIGFSHTTALVDVAGDSNTQLLSPILPFGGHDQNLTYSEESLNLPLKPDDGVLRVDVFGLAASAGAALTPALQNTPTDGDITDWSVSAWGRTVPTAFTAPINRTF